MKLDNNEKFSIYRLCRNEEVFVRLKKENNKYPFIQNILVTNLNYFEFINKIIAECQDEYALVCHDDVTLPLDISYRISETITKANEEFGNDSWGVVSNSGVEFLSNKSLKYFKDNDFISIQPGSLKPRLAVFLDDNTLLLNLKNIRENSISLPNKFEGFHLYNFILLVECYKKGLICAIDSNLFVIHKSSGDQTEFNKTVKNQRFINYWTEKFTNHSIKTTFGSVNIEYKLDYNKKRGKEPKKDFYVFIYEILKGLYIKKSKKNIYIITRTILNRNNVLKRNLNVIREANVKYKEEINIKVILSINNIDFEVAKPAIESIKKEYSDLDINYLFNNQSKNKYSRVFALENAIYSVSNEKNSYIWIVDDDDFIFIDALKYFPIILDESRVLVGNSVVFEEKWINKKELFRPVSSKKIKKYNTSDYFKCFLGNNHVPICSAIYSTKVLKKIFKEYKLAGDYFEDYTIFLLAQNILDVTHYPISIAGISSHGENTTLEGDRTHWDYSYATFVSEIVNSNTIKSWIYDFVSHLDNDNQRITELNKKIEDRDQEILQIRQKLNFVKSSKFWKMRNNYMRLKSLLSNKKHL